MGLNTADFLASKPAITEEPAPIEGSLSKEDFDNLNAEVMVFKKQIERGETLTVKEAAKITVWFRARRAEAFTVAVAKAKPKKKAAATPRKRKTMSAAEKVELSNALIDAL